MPEREGEPGLRQQLREAIRASGRSLNQLSVACGVGRDRLSRFVRGERGMSLEAAEKVCAALGLKLVRQDRLGEKPSRRRGKE